MDESNKSSTKEDWITVGRIRTAFGVKGWLKLESFTEPADNIELYNCWRLSQGKQSKPIVIEQITVKQIDARRTDILVKLEGIENREDARLLANSLVQVPKAELPALDEEEFYWHQLVGLAVYQIADNPDDALELIGTIASLLETGANDVLVVQRSAGKSVSKTGTNAEHSEILIPYLPETVVKKVDIEQARILVDWFYD